jgi:hypothetical protein
MDHSLQYAYYSGITHMASYDLLIDEKWIDGTRVKRRWPEEEAWDAVEETIDAAQFLVDNRNIVPSGGLILSAQGVSVEQYALCTREVAQMVEETDMVGLGGWCILGKQRSLFPIFVEIMDAVIPIIAASPCRRVHIWGMMYAPALAELLWLCNRYGLQLSVDSSGPQRRPAMGTWGYAEWIDKSYQRPDISIRGQERKRHVTAVREWLANFEDTPWYKRVCERREQ